MNKTTRYIKLYQWVDEKVDVLVVMLVLGMVVLWVAV